MMIHLYNFIKQCDEIQSAYLTMNRMVFLLSVAILLTMKEKQQSTKPQLSMKAVFSEVRCIDIY